MLQTRLEEIMAQTGNRAVDDNNSVFYNVCILSLSRDDIDFLLEKTSFDEYDIREWFRAFIKVF